MRDAGVRYLVGDNSKPRYDNSSPNAGLPHPLEPSILIIPRYPNNLGFDVSTAEEWRTQYNDRYRDRWGRDLSYEEILDKESEVLLSYLLKGNIHLASPGGGEGIGDGPTRRGSGALR